jgi:hypothetical protein
LVAGELPEEEKEKKDRYHLVNRCASQSIARTVVGKEKLQEKERPEK